MTPDRIRASEVIAALSLATDLGIAVPLEHGLHSTLFAMRLAERLGVDASTALETYYACQLFYVGCTANADLAAELFGADDALTVHGMPGRFGTRVEMAAGLLRAVAPPGTGPLVRVRQLAHGIPRVVAVFNEHVAAFCEVARMLTERLGLDSSVGALFGYATERWDSRGDEIPLAMRIVHVARDAAFQRLLGGVDRATHVIRRRAGRAFDPSVARLLADEAGQILTLDPSGSAWDEVLALEPGAHIYLEGAAIDTALAAMGDFADLMSPSFWGHSRGVAELAAAAAGRCGLDVDSVRRAGLVHDIGRVAVPARVWKERGPLTPDDWERVRLHPYQTERVLHRSPLLASLAAVAGAHHERCDGSGYHRGTSGPSLTPPARLLAAADAYHTKTELRPHRKRLTPEAAAEALANEARAGRLDADAAAAVLQAAGQSSPRVERPAGLTERETEVVVLLARGLQTKQIARALGIAVKTADNHIQNAYRKIGVSTRAAAALFAMQHGLTSWGELPIAPSRRRA